MERKHYGRGLGSVSTNFGKELWSASYHCKEKAHFPSYGCVSIASDQYGKPKTNGNQNAQRVGAIQPISLSLLGGLGDTHLRHVVNLRGV